MDIPHYRILMVADNEERVSVVHKLLAGNKHFAIEIDWADSDLSAYRLLDQNQYDLYLLWHDAESVRGLWLDTWNGSPEYLDPAIIVVENASRTKDQWEYGTTKRCIAQSDLTDKNLQQLVFNTMTEHRNISMSLHLSQFDELTGLPSRNQLRSRLVDMFAQSNRARQLVGLAKINLDGFRNVRLTHGEEESKAILKGIAQRIADSVRNTDIAARIAGDEFVVAATQINNDKDTAVLAENLLKACRYTTNQGIEVTGSIGLAIYPQDAESIEELWALSSHALLNIKNAGGNAYQFTDAVLDAEIRRKQRLREDIRLALINDQFEVFYQPILALEDDTIYGVETLLRWHHPKEGVLSPSHFIEDAEASGQIHAIGDWLLCEVAKKQIETKAKGLPNTPTGINVSAIQLERHTLALRLQKLTREESFDPSNIHFEISEVELQKCDDLCIENLIELYHLGAGLAIDSFGRADGAILPLRRLPIDSIKMDPSLISGLADSTMAEAMAKGVVQLCEAMGITCIAAGVENEAPLNKLRALGCDAAQGYQIAHPMNITEFGHWYSNRLAQS